MSSNEPSEISSAILAAIFLTGLTCVWWLQVTH